MRGHDPLEIQNAELIEKIAQLKDFMWCAEHAQGANMENTSNAVCGEISGESYIPNNKGDYPVSLYARFEGYTLGLQIKQLAADNQEQLPEDVKVTIRRLSRFMAIKRNDPSLALSTVDFE